MNARCVSGHRFVRSLLVCLCVALLALQPVTAHAKPIKPAITVTVVSSPLHLHIHGSHFTPSKNVEVKGDYVISKTVHPSFSKVIPASKTGTFSVNIAGPSVHCGTVLYQVYAYTQGTNTVSNVVIQFFSFPPCS